jgi:hypothetical protein
MLRRTLTGIGLSAFTLGALVATGGVANRPANAAAIQSESTMPRKLEYNRDIRPILSNNCFKCHGLDERTRKAGLRLDHRDDATRPSQLGGTAIVPFEPSRSELIRRVFSSDEAVVMPPPASQRSLSAAEKTLLRTWIEQGAEYQPHWSFIPPGKVSLPAVSQSKWPRNAIDYFILARLESERLLPSPEADRATLIRRVSFDLTGLPATPDEISAFVADAHDDAYERVVDRLLNSPRFGERMALDWLDAARFADTHGYHIDSGRDMTHWRDWVISAFNGNKPFDEFTVEQVAGDLLPNATVEQRIASGFHRNHMINYEGGAIPEEYHTAYIVDRVNTTGTVWLGMTVGCAQCHDHKYDPVSQRDYYSLYAFFHNVPENGLDGKTGNATPVLKLPTAEQRSKLDQGADAIAKLEQKIGGPIADVDDAQAIWEQEIARGIIHWVPLDLQELQSKGGANFARLEDQSIVVTGPNAATETYTVVAGATLDSITAIRLEAMPDERFAGNGPGRSSNGNIVLTDVRVSARLPDQPNSTPVKIKSASADFSQKDFPIAGAIDDQSSTGWAIHPEIGKPHAAVFQFDSPLACSVPASLKTSQGDPQTPDATNSRIILTITLDFQSQFAQHQLGRFRLSVTDSAEPHETQQVPANIRAILAIEHNEWTQQQRSDVQKFFRTTISPITKEMTEQLAKLRKDQAELEKQVSTTMVMQEMEKPRDTFMLIRGQYDKRGEQVTAGIPPSLGSLPAGSPPNRLGLAKWLIDPTQPLTARVIVNRYWQMYFGTGIVKTAEDFGSQGEWPSHPELLDWLATEFRDSGWDIKHMQRLIVTSAAYRQSSAVTPAGLAKDPENRLLARGPRLRLQAEFIRDQALMVSGLLNEEIGGNSVAPYQPPGIWEELAYRQDGKNFTAQEYIQSHGEGLYRRTMYTFIKRTAPPPTLVTFDAPDRETCTVRRSRTNTPLQALVLMNDPTYVEAARKLAERVMTEIASEPTAENRINCAFRLATGRSPAAAELQLLRHTFDAELEAYRSDSAAALKLLYVGESTRDDRLDPAELAAWTLVASVILNLDETVTKN